jgi:molecular chaperone IbpA
MRTYDFSPLFRSTIGFDRLFDLAETAQRAANKHSQTSGRNFLSAFRSKLAKEAAVISPHPLFD